MINGHEDIRTADIPIYKGPNPEKIDKYLYVEKTPTWLVRTVFAVSIVAWIFVLYGYSGVLVYDPFYRWVAGPLLGFLSIYYLLSYGLNMFYMQFNLQDHILLTKRYWTTRDSEPSVDIFLPICGEDVSILRNTWTHVTLLRYANKHIYVLDD